MANIPVLDAEEEYNIMVRRVNDEWIVEESLETNGE